MKQIYTRATAILILALHTACSSTNLLTLHTMEPSPVALSKQIKRIGIINGTTPSEKQTINTRIDQILAAEAHWLSEKGTDAAITGLMEELVIDQRFDTIKLIQTASRINAEAGVENDTLSWKQMKTLCDEHEVDAIFTLAFYDTETRVSLKKTSMEQPNLLRVKVKIPAHEITLETLIANGWRIYDPYEQKVIDEIVFNDQIVSTAKGANPVDALRAIDNRKETVLEQSRNTGTHYGQRLLPSQQRLVREYFIKGSEHMERAEALLLDGKWQEAAGLWEIDTTHPKVKIRARALHNMAVYHEYLQQLQTALSWATQAYELDPDKKALSYLDALNHRIAQDRLLEQQLAANLISK